MQEATTLVLLSSQTSFFLICCIALLISSNFISDKIPLLPPTFIARSGVSFSRFLNVLRVVPSPPSVITRSSFIFRRSSKEFISSPPLIDTGEIV